MTKMRIWLSIIGIYLEIGYCALVIAELCSAQQMQQFTVPQFIETEDKIIGPITTRQFLILTFCFSVIGVFYKVFDFSLFVTASIVWFAIWVVVAFVKINGRPFHFFVLNVIQTFKKPNLRVWQQISSPEIEIFEEIKEKKEYIPQKPKTLTTSRLTELSLIVDTSGNYKTITYDELPKTNKN